MKLITKQRFYILISLSCLLSFTILFSACDLFGSGTTAKATPTPPPLKLYNEGNYSISYPQGWTVTESDGGLSAEGGKAVKFADNTGVSVVSIEEFRNPNGLVPTSQIEQSVIKALKTKSKNVQDTTVTPKPTIGSQNWDEHLIVGDFATSGTTVQTKTAFFACNHPISSAQTRLYTINAVSPALTFDIANATYFQPMVQSFKFTTA